MFVAPKMLFERLKMAFSALHSTQTLFIHFDKAYTFSNIDRKQPRRLVGKAILSKFQTIFSNYSKLQFMHRATMEAHTQNTTSTIVEELQPVPQQEASTSQQAIQPPHPTATTAEQHLRLRLVPKKKKKKKVRAYLYSL